MKFASIGSRDASPSALPVEETGSSGFTLLETLAALTILATAFATLLSVFSTGINAADAGRNYATATVFAENLMAAADVTPKRSQSGRSGGFRWSVKVTGVAPDDPSLAPPSPWKLQKVTVTVSWAKRRMVRLDKIRLVRGDG